MKRKRLDGLRNICYLQNEMTTMQATIEVFATAINSLPRQLRKGLVERLLSDSENREDLIDVARWLERKSEPSIPYAKARKHLRRNGRI